MPDSVLLRLNPAKIVLLSKLIEAFGHIGIVSTVDAKEGLVIVRGTPDTLDEIRRVLSNLPFPLEIISE